MTPEQTRQALGGLNMSSKAAGKALGVNERTIRRWKVSGAPNWLPHVIKSLQSNNT